ncbi:MAG TPA: type III-B CRISPR module RAMP protein Cmr4 [Ktedonobacteraceae bacterium]|nr:type III-B CRISPR module RAMP protein Cmr4 [Ktedonobacteraceae bacterium]
MKSQLTFVHALSPLHAGVGQGAGVIDMPIAREKATGLPFLPGSSIKGALRTRAQQDGLSQEYKDIFGSDPAEPEKMRASSVLFSDQRLLLLPARSIAGTFAWVTSPYVLQRFMRDLKEVPVPEPAPKTIPAITGYNTCHLTEEGKSTLAVKNNVYLEDFDLQVQDDAALAPWATWLSTHIFPGLEKEAWQHMFIERLCLVHDDLFHFMSQHSTEVTARIRLKEDTRTVTDGGLWYEEALPTETILSGIAVITPVSSLNASTGQKNGKISEGRIMEILKDLTGKTLQFGGKATVGRGICRAQLV